MDYGFRVEPFACATSVGNQTISISSSPAPSRTPKAAIFMVSRATAADVTTPGGMIGGGITDGTTSVALAAMGEDGALVAIADTGRRQDNTGCIQIIAQANETLEARATFVSFGTDQVTINWGSGEVPPLAYLGFVVLFYGNDLSANVQQVVGNATQNSSTDSTTLSFTPDFLIAIHAGVINTTNGGFNELIFGIGSAGRLPSVTQSCAVITAEDREAPTSCGGLVRDDAIAARIASAAGTVTEGARLEASFSSDHYTLTTRNASAALCVAVLAVSIGGLRVWSDALLVDTNATGDKAITDPGFKPKGLLMFGAFCAALNTVASNAASVVVAAYSDLLDTDVGSVECNVEDGQGTTSASQSSRGDLVYLVTSDDVFDYVLSLASLDPTGFTLNVSTAGAADRPIAFLAIGEQRTDHPELSIERCRPWRRRLVRM